MRNPSDEKRKKQESTIGALIQHVKDAISLSGHKKDRELVNYALLEITQENNKYILKNMRDEEVVWTSAKDRPVPWEKGSSALVLCCRKVDGEYTYQWCEDLLHYEDRAREDWLSKVVFWIELPAPPGLPVIEEVPKEIIEEKRKYTDEIQVTCHCGDQYGSRCKLPGCARCIQEGLIKSS